MEGTARVVAFPVLVLPTAAYDLSSALLTGLKVRFRAHITALPLRAIRALSVLRASFWLEGEIRCLQGT